MTELLPVAIPPVIATKNIVLNVLLFIGFKQNWSQSRFVVLFNCYSSQRIWNYCKFVAFLSLSRILLNDWTENTFTYATQSSLFCLSIQFCNNHLIWHNRVMCWILFTFSHVNIEFVQCIWHPRTHTHMHGYIYNINRMTCVARPCDKQLNVPHAVRMTVSQTRYTTIARWLW